MPLIDKDHPLHPKVICYNEDGTFMGNVSSCDTDEGWIEVYVLYPPDKESHTRVMVDRLKQESVKVRVYCGFRLEDRATGKTLYSAGWSLKKDNGVNNLNTKDWTKT